MTPEELRELIQAKLAPKDPLTELAEDAKLIPDKYCKHCNAPWWEDFGECHNCTPHEVLDARDAVVDARVDASKIYEEQTKLIREAFIEEQIKEKIQTHKELYNLNKPPNYAPI